MEKGFVCKQMGLMNNMIIKGQIQFMWNYKWHIKCSCSQVRLD